MHTNACACTLGGWGGALASGGGERRCGWRVGRQCFCHYPSLTAAPPTPIAAAAYPCLFFFFFFFSVRSSPSVSNFSHHIFTAVCSVRNKNFTTLLPPPSSRFPPAPCLACTHRHTPRVPASPTAPLPPKSKGLSKKAGIDQRSTDQRQARFRSPHPSILGTTSLASLSFLTSLYLSFLSESCHPSFSIDVD